MKATGKLHWPYGELDDPALDDPEDGAFAYCGRFRYSPDLTTDPEKVTCKVCLNGAERSDAMMRFDDWCDFESARRSAWQKTAPWLTYDEALNVVRGAKTREALLTGGVYLALLPEEGIEDMSVDPRPLFLDRDQEGASRRTKFRPSFPVHCESEGESK